MPLLRNGFNLLPVSYGGSNWRHFRVLLGIRYPLERRLYNEKCRYGKNFEADKGGHSGAAAGTGPRDGQPWLAVTVDEHSYSWLEPITGRDVTSTLRAARGEISSVIIQALRARQHSKEAPTKL